MYVKGRTSRTIKVVKATMMPSHILHGQPIPPECAVVEVTMIREGRELEDLDYPDEDEGIEKLVDAKETMILWPRKDIIIKTHSSPLFHHRTQRLGALLLQTCQSLLKSLTHQRLLFLLKTVKTQSSKRAQGEVCHLQQKSLKAQSSRTTGSMGHLLLLLETKSSWETRSIGRLLLILETKSSRAIRSVSCLLLLLETKSSRAIRSVGHLLLLFEIKISRATRSVGHLLLLLKTKSSRATRILGCHLLLLKY
jgi:hypothetical protein